MFSYEFCETFRSTFFTEQLQTTASVGRKNSFKTEQRNHQEMLYEMRDLPISDTLYEITSEFTKILDTNQVVDLQLKIL